MKTTKKALALSVLSLILCVTMLLGTTYAWFTDSVKSGVNKIEAGNLDIELEYFDGSNWNPVTESVSLFDDNALWEPGYTEVAYLRLSNKGTLALKYNLAINVYSEKAGTNVAGETFKLSDYINMGVDENWGGEEVYADRAAARAAVTDAGSIKAYTKTGNMNAGADALTFAIVVYMPEEVGNVANYQTGTPAPYIEMGVEVLATQDTVEADSFDKNYDIDAPYLGGTDDAGLAENTKADTKTVEIQSAEQLTSFANAVNTGTTYDGYTVKLMKNIDLNNVEWTQINGAGHGITFDGNNKTIKNLKVSNGHNAGFFATGSGCTIKNLTFENASVTGVGRIAVIVGHGMCATVENCKVMNSTVTAVVTNNDDGDKAGAIVGYLSGEPDAKVINCTVEGCTVTGYRDTGALVGYAGGTYTVTGNTVKNCIVINDRTNNYKSYNDDAEFDVNEIIGEKGSAGTDNSNTATKVTISKIAPIVVPADKTATQAVTAAIASAESGDTLILPKNSEVDLTAASLGSKELNLKGDKTTVVSIKPSGQTFGAGSNVNFEGVTVRGVVDGSYGYKGLDSNTATYTNCTFEGCTTLYGNSVTFNNCTFNQSYYEYSVYTYGAKVATFNNCTFNSIGKALKAYCGGNTTVVNVNDCTFNIVGTISPSANKPAIAVDTDTGNCGITVNVNNCSQTGYKNTDTDMTLFEGALIGFNTNDADRTTITINGVQVQPAN